MRHNRMKKNRLCGFTIYKKYQTTLCVKWQKWRIGGNYLRHFLEWNIEYRMQIDKSIFFYK